MLLKKNLRYTKIKVVFNRVEICGGSSTAFAAAGCKVHCIFFRSYCTLKDMDININNLLCCFDIFKDKYGDLPNLHIVHYMYAAEKKYNL